MTSEILITPERLSELIQAGPCTVVDCRFDLTNPDRGKANWLAGHIPGAGYAHLDHDLASPVGAQTGRHPLPVTTQFAQFLASVGWSKRKLLVAYDESSNAISARLWWLMRFYGQNAALLDGGLAAWTGAGFVLEKGAPRVEPVGVTNLEPTPGLTTSAPEILGNLGRVDWVVVDARAGERYSGKVEPLDTEAGHIPGSLNRPFHENLDESGRFQSPERLKAGFQALLGSAHPEKVIHSCGSGVTACHNLFAMELAGLGFTNLYPGSWSEWIRDPSRPIKTGNDP